MIARALVEVELVIDAGGKRSKFIFNPPEPSCKQSSAMIIFSSGLSAAFICERCLFRYSNGLRLVSPNAQDNSARCRQRSSVVIICVQRQKRSFLQRGKGSNRRLG